MTSTPGSGPQGQQAQGHALATDDLSEQVLKQDMDVRAWVHVAETVAARNAPTSSGPLAGMPFGVKDVIDVAGMPTRCGSSAGTGQAAAFDAACVSQLRHAGAIPLGKTVTAEFAFRAPGPTRNPHNLQHTPGGSSSGSAAAVAAGMVPFALGTQTGGSIIRPAAFCGVIGFKPSFGAVQRDGMKQTCDSLDVIGWFANDMALTQAVADVLLPYSALAADAPRINNAVLVLDSSDHPLDDDAYQALMSACERLRESGVTVREAPSFPHAGELAQLHTTIMEFEIARCLQPVVDLQPTELSDALLETVARGLRVSNTAYSAARRSQRQLRYAWNSIAGADTDVIITPSTPGAAPAGLASTGTSAFNKPWSVLGWPCLHLPTTRNAQGLPLGIQLVANYEDDHRLLDAASSWHAALKVA